MQVPGAASVIDADRICDFANEIPALRRLLVNYGQFFVSQVQQTAACNALHNIQARTGKCLLRMHHLAGPIYR
jgi:hypothetical protein